MSAQKIQTGLRIPESRYEELVKLAERSGISVNAAVLMLVDIGLDVINRGKVESLRALLHMSADTSEEPAQSDC